MAGKTFSSAKGATAYVSVSGNYNNDDCFVGLPRMNLQCFAFDYYYSWPSIKSCIGPLYYHSYSFPFFTAAGFSIVFSTRKSHINPSNAFYLRYNAAHNAHSGRERKLDATTLVSKPLRNLLEYKSGSTAGGNVANNDSSGTLFTCV